MVDRGARNLVFPSRPGISSQAASKVVAEFTGQGINIITPRCDVSSSRELSTLLQTCPNMAPIRGCINLAMVLQDAIFENMTHAQWTETIRSKVDATRKLHRLLPPKMNFFILASSFSARILVPQSRLISRGSIDLAWIEDIKIDATNVDRFHSMSEHVRHMGTISTRDVLAILEHYYDPTQPAVVPDEVQLLIGTNIPSVSYASGQDALAGHLMRPMFAPFIVKRPNRPTYHKLGPASAQEDAVQGFRNAEGILKRGEAVVNALKIKLSLALGLQVEDMYPRKSLSDYDVDSLMAVDLRNWEWRNFKASVAVFDIMDGKPLKQAAQLLAEKA